MNNVKTHLHLVRYVKACFGISFNFARQSFDSKDTQLAVCGESCLAKEFWSTHCFINVKQKASQVYSKEGLPNRLPKTESSSQVYVVSLYILLVNCGGKLDHTSSTSLERMCFPGTMAKPRILGSSFSSATQRKNLTWDMKSDIIGGKVFLNFHWKF